MPLQYQRLVVPLNGTAGDDRVLALVSQLVQKNATNLTLVYVVEVAQSMPLDAELPDDIDQGETILINAERIARAALPQKSDCVMTELLQARSAGAAIVDEAIERRADAIVMSAESQRKHGKTSLGETVAYVLKNAPCEVIVMRQSLSDQPS